MMNIEVILLISSLFCFLEGVWSEVPGPDSNSGGGSNSDSSRTLCAYTNKKVTGKENGLQIGEKTHETDTRILLHNNTVERCEDNLHLCYTFWYIDPEDQAFVTILKQGCWNNDRPKCSRRECVADSALETKSISNITRWCCCQGNLCNVNVSDIFVPGGQNPGTHGPHTVVEPYINDPGLRLRTIVTSLSLVIALSVVVICIYVCIRRYQLQRHASRHGVEGGGANGGLGMLPAGLNDGSNSLPVYELDNLKLNTVIHSGRYGEVWKGTLNDIMVAVKVYRAGQRNLYINEREILNLPLLDPKHVPQFYGAEEKVTLDGMPEYLLVMHYEEQGTLQTYLKNNILDWSKMCTILHSIAAGLVHLHTELIKGDKVKPAIAHRDINTRNILIRSDLICVICDFGYAMKLDRHHSEELGEQPTLSDVGTIRYMAPEVLDGAVNLRECEASLKQIDIYALGLVYWEVGMRCSDLYQGIPVPEYQLPYQSEVGVHPSFEEMQDQVSRNKLRPLFPDVWKSSNPAIRALKETIEDCWDQDGEARLTVNCVEERVLEMQALWEARTKGVTPTLNVTASVGHVEGKKSEPCNLPPPPPPAVSHHYHPPRLDHYYSTDSSGGSGSSHAARYSMLDNSVSEATTDTTLLSPSDSDLGSVMAAGSSAAQYPSSSSVQPGPPLSVQVPPNRTSLNLMYYPAQARKLAPHHGKNPTVARNTHKCSDEDVTIQGNTLVNNSAAANGGNLNNGLEHEVSSPLLTDALIDVIQTTLVRQDLLNHPCSDDGAAEVHDNPVSSEPLIVQQCPKQPNLPQPGSTKNKSFFSRFQRRPKVEKPAAVASSSGGSSKGFTLPFFNRNAEHSGSSNDDGGEENLDNLVEIRPGGHHRTRSSEGEIAAMRAKSNLYRRPPPSGATLSTEVRIVNGMPVVQPSTSSYTTPPRLSSDSDISPGFDSSDSTAPRRPNSLLLHGGHNYAGPSLPPDVSGRQNNELVVAPAAAAAPPVGHNNQGSIHPGAAVMNGNNNAPVVNHNAPVVNHNNLVYPSDNSYNGTVNNNNNPNAALSVNVVPNRQEPILAVTVPVVQPIEATASTTNININDANRSGGDQKSWNNANKCNLHHAAAFENNGNNVASASNAVAAAAASQSIIPEENDTDAVPPISMQRFSDDTGVNGITESSTLSDAANVITENNTDVHRC